LNKENEGRGNAGGVARDTTFNGWKEKSVAYFSFEK
jgi:hypothetical protein